MKVSDNIIKPKHETLELQGELSYSEGLRAWNLMRLKKDLLKEFPQLKERREKFSYKMIMHRNFNDLKKAVENLENKEIIPIFLFFVRK
jgi:uncharacterized protein with von Willebrand factor type A (vWA) domain